MKNLLRNESIKTFRQSGYKVLIIIILVLALLIPVGHFLLNQLIEWFSGGYSAQQQYEMYEEMAEEYADVDDPSAQMEEAVYRADAETIKFFMDNDMEQGWKYEMFLYDLMSDREVLALYRLLSEGEIVYDDVQDSYYDWMIEEDLNEAIYGEDASIDFDGFMPDVKAESEELPKIDPDEVNWAAEYQRKSEYLTERESYILTCTPKILLAGEVERYEKMLSLAKAEMEAAKEKLELAEAALAGGGEGVTYVYESAKYTYDRAESEALAYEEILWGNRFLYDNDCDPDSWQYQAVNTVLISAASSYYASSVILPESLWKESGYGYEYETYEEYAEAMETNPERGAQGDALLTVRYALEHDIPLADVQTNSPKANYRGYFSAVMGLISILMIVMAGMIVANEYSSGTIRLLLIRPRKRYKILTSKILCVVFYALGLMVVCGVILLILTMIFFGVSDLFAPDLYVMGGNVIEIPALLTMLAKGVLIFLGMLLTASIALFFSVVTKKAALAIAIPLILYSAWSMVQLLSLELIEYLPFLKFTVLPFLAPEVLLTTPIEYATYSTAYGMYYGQIVSLSGVYGLFIVLLHIGGIGALTYLIFNRQQIKS